MGVTGWALLRIEPKKDFLFFWGGSSVSASEKEASVTGDNGSVASPLVCASVSSHSGRSFNRSLLNFLSERVELGRKANDLNPGSKTVAIQ